MHSQQAYNNHLLICGCHLFYLIIRVCVLNFLPSGIHQISFEGPLRVPDPLLSLRMQRKVPGVRCEQKKLNISQYNSQLNCI